jgi:hypothetical protein
MMSLTVWARLALSLAVLHLVSNVVSYCRVTWHCSGDKRVVNSAGITLLSHCRCLSARLAGIDNTACLHIL